ncbi:MAG: response regulator transcription factor, partial [Dactylosporangium sp.]|nr:hypothetical protein [Dactylosporangium sp.]NNJ63596.1 response regulator transcription factor [Dactylosporangium sp.]
QRLHIGEGTVKTHVTHVLQKLSLRDRVQVVVFAYQTGLFEPDARHAPPERPPISAFPRSSRSRPGS